MTSTHELLTKDTLEADPEKLIHAPSPDEVEKLRHRFSADGFVILKGVIPTASMIDLRQKMEGDALYLYQRNEWGGDGAVPGNLQLPPPPHKKYVLSEIFSNERIFDVVRKILGDGFFLSYYTCNANYDSQVPQKVHADAPSLWSPKSEALEGAAHPTTTLVVNIPLCDVDELNGATEIYPGTHKIQFSGDLYASPPEKNNAIRAVMKFGDVLVRDIRTLHRGMPNLSGTPRLMLGIICNVWWLQRSTSLRLQTGAESACRLNYIDYNVNYVENFDDYLRQKPGYFQVPYLYEGVYPHQIA